MLEPIIIPSSYNYIAVFLTLSCNLECSYCINRFGGPARPRTMMSGEDWVAGMNRIVSRPDLPVTLGGGEPSLHPDFIQIINGLKENLSIDLLTNLQFDIASFMAKVQPDRIKRESPYASIRVSYHPGMMDLELLMDDVLSMLKAGYSVGIWGVLHPEQEVEILRAQETCLSVGIDFRTKEFLGEYNNVLHGSFNYSDACNRETARHVKCRTSELIIGPGGDIYRCHGDLYDDRLPIGHILDPNFVIDEDFKDCDCYGFCNPCDIKLKTNRYQIFGHTSVEILGADTP